MLVCVNMSGMLIKCSMKVYKSTEDRVQWKCPNLRNMPQYTSPLVELRYSMQNEIMRSSEICHSAKVCWNYGTLMTVCELRKHGKECRSVEQC